MEDNSSFKILNKFIQQEIENSDDKYALTSNEIREVFKNAIQAVEELQGTKIDLTRFNEFLSFYKIMKIVEQVSEEIRSDKYLQDMQDRVKPRGDVNVKNS